MVKEHQKPYPQAGKQGGIIEKEMPLPVSKVAIRNPGAKKGDRIGIKTLGDGRVVVESVNMVKKHQKPNPQAGKQGGIIEKEMPLPLSKVAIWNPGAKKGDRIGIKTLADGKRVRFFKSNGEMLDV